MTFSSSSISHQHSYSINTNGLSNIQEKSNSLLNELSSGENKSLKSAINRRIFLGKCESIEESAEWFYSESLEKLRDQLDNISVDEVEQVFNQLLKDLTEGKERVIGFLCLIDCAREIKKEGGHPPVWEQAARDKLLEALNLVSSFKEMVLTPKDRALLAGMYGKDDPLLSMTIQEASDYLHYLLIGEKNHCLDSDKSAVYCRDNLSRGFLIEQAEKGYLSRLQDLKDCLNMIPQNSMEQVVRQLMQELNNRRRDGVRGFATAH